MKTGINQPILPLAFQTPERIKALESFVQKGIPTTKNEEWKYTSLREIQKVEFEEDTWDWVEIRRNILSDPIFKLDAYKLVFVNGELQSELSDIISTNNIRVLSARELSANKKCIPTDSDSALNQLNQALYTDGAYIEIEANQTLDKAILLFNYQSAQKHATQQHIRNFIFVNEAANCRVIEYYTGIGKQHSYLNSFNEIIACKNSKLEHYTIQNRPDAAFQTHFTQINQDETSDVHQVTLTLNGKFTRNNLHFFHAGEYCQSLLYGLYVLNQSEFVDNHTRVDHAFPNGYSDEKYKGILKDKSTAVFNGKIHVHEQAQKTNAYQRNQNVLLSDEATVNTKPQLEIFADDVKCTHGATIGQLDSEALFYLRSRGISENAAYQLLLNAFADEIAEKIRIPELVDILENVIASKI